MDKKSFLRLFFLGSNKVRGRGLVMDQRGAQYTLCYITCSFALYSLTKDQFAKRNVTTLKTLWPFEQNPTSRVDHFSSAHIVQHNNRAQCGQRRSKKVAIAQPQNGVIYPPASLDSNPVTLSSSLPLSLFLCLSMLPPFTATLSFALLPTRHKVEPEQETLTGQRYPRYWLNDGGSQNGICLKGREGFSSKTRHC